MHTEHVGSTVASSIAVLHLCQLKTNLGCRNRPLMTPCCTMCCQQTAKHAQRADARCVPVFTETFIAATPTTHLLQLPLPALQQPQVVECLSVVWVQRHCEPETLLSPPQLAYANGDLTATQVTTHAQHKLRWVCVLSARRRLQLVQPGPLRGHNASQLARGLWVYIHACSTC